jgi:transcriptional regulator with XRE-family HTH domain
MQQVLLALGDRMRKLRAERGLSQEAFADHCGLHRTAVGLIERGHRVPSLKTLLTISTGFGISLSELLRNIDKGSVKKR